jgi:hypothetical protein
MHLAADASDPLDALLGGAGDLSHGGGGSVCQLDVLEVGPQALDRVEARGQGLGAALPPAGPAVWARKARMARLRWAPSPSHNKVAFWSPRERRSSPSTPMSESVS